MDAASLYDLTPVLNIALLGLVLALGPLPGLGAQPRRGARRAPARADLADVVPDLRPGAVRRLHAAHDSGLGCPDCQLLRQRQPGRAHAQIHAEQACGRAGR